MRVAHVMFFGEKERKHPFSGAENHLFTLLEGLASLGMQVRLIGLVLHNGPTIEKKFEELRSRGVDVLAINRRAFKGAFAKAITTCKLLFDFRRELQAAPPDIVHFHLDEWYCPFLSIGTGVHSRVFSFHCDEPRYNSFAYKLLFVVLDCIIDRYIGITEHVSSFCSQALRINPAKVETIYYGVKEPSPRPRQRSDFGLPADTFLIGFVGRLTEQKNLFVFCDALALVPDAFGVIVGGGALESDVLRHIRERSITNVLLTGPVSNGSEVIQLFDLFCLPSNWEGLGIVLLEAMYLGIPIVGSQKGAIPEILGEGEFGMIVDCNSSESLAEGLKRCMANRDEINERAKWSKVVAKERFSVTQMLRKTHELYIRLSKKQLKHVS